MPAKCQAPSQFSGRSSPMVEDEMERDNLCPSRVGPGGSEQQEIPPYNSEETEEGVRWFTFLPDLSLLFLHEGIGLHDLRALWFGF